MTFAAWYLLLPIDADTRRALEQQARRRALVVEQQYQLYPASIDETFIPAARVEAALRRSRQAPEQQQDDTLAPFYIELNPGDKE